MQAYLLIVAGVLAGDCAKLPCGAIAPPNGSHVREFQHLQTVKAEADDFVVYKNEWYLGGTTPGPFGLYHLNEIARRASGSPFPVVIQPELDPAANEARRDAVVKHLLAAGVPDARTRVIIALPQAEGLGGEDAVRLGTPRPVSFPVPYFGFGPALPR
jgi:hypothetical protein